MILLARYLIVNKHLLTYQSILSLWIIKYSTLSFALSCLLHFWIIFFFSIMIWCNYSFVQHHKEGPNILYKAPKIPFLQGNKFAFDLWPWPHAIRELPFLTGMEVIHLRQRGTKFFFLTHGNGVEKIVDHLSQTGFLSELIVL